MDEEKELWYISVIDVLEVLTETGQKVFDLKPKLKKEGSELIGQLKIPVPDGKMRLTDIVDTEQIFRLTTLIHKIDKDIFPDKNNRIDPQTY